jgi:hypothetical protein
MYSPLTVILIEVSFWNFKSDFSAQPEGNAPEFSLSSPVSTGNTFNKEAHISQNYPFSTHTKENFSLTQRTFLSSTKGK